MKLSFSVSTTLEEKYRFPETNTYMIDEIGRRVGYDITKNMLQNNECLVSSKEENFMINDIYEVYVFTPEEMKRLHYEIARNIQLGLPIIY